MYRKQKRLAWIAFICLVFVIVMTGCGKDGGNQQAGDGGSTPPPTSKDNEQTAEPKTEPKPVELTFFSSYSGFLSDLSDGGFMQSYGDYMKKKYPHLSFKTIFGHQTKQSLSEFVASQTPFDMGFISPVGAYEFVDLQIASDITDLVKKHNFDLNSIDSSSLSLLTKASYDQLIGLPFQVNSFVLFYNKDIFDKFGVDYPRDDLTWDDMLEIVRAVTRMEDGVQYKGFSAQQAWQNVLRGNQLSLEPLDVTNYKVIFNNDGWRRIFEQFKPIFQIEGNQYINGGANGNAFIKDRNMAMILAYPDYYLQFPDDLNWDVAASPSFKERPGVNWQPVPIVMYPAAQSPHREEAFLAIAELLSKEVQLDRARKLAIASVLPDPEIREQIGIDIPELQDKNRQVMQPTNMAAPITFTPYTTDAMSSALGLAKAFGDVMEDVKDVNTALREAEESANAKISERLEAAPKSQ